MQLGATFVIAAAAVTAAVLVPGLSAGNQLDVASLTRSQGAPPVKTCNRFAATRGSDSARGTLRAPYRTVQRLVNSLRPGMTGCLLPGVYGETVNFRHGGSPERRVVLRTAPGNRRPAVIHGDIVQNPTAPYVTIDSVAVDARGTAQSVAVQLLGDGGRLTRSIVFGGDEANRIGVGIGYDQTVTGVEVDHNRVSGFGSDSDKDHGIYVVNAVGSLVHDNYIFDNSGYGIHLWTHSIDGRFYDNTIDGNGTGSIMIAGQWNTFGEPSSRNAFYGNILSNPGSGKNVLAFWSASGSPGADNVVSDNCLWKGSLVDAPGVTYTDNITADPSYTDRIDRIFRLEPRSGCDRYGVRAGRSDTVAGAQTP